MNSKRSAYIVTKPIQYINATNIVDDNLKDCLLIDLFSDSDLFYNQIKTGSDHWDRVLLFKNRQSAFNHLIRNRNQYEKLFLDSDQGIVTLYRLFRLRTIRIFTYEEGYGSYRRLRDEGVPFEKLKLLIYRAIHCGNYFGSSYYTQGIILYHPKAFQKLIPENRKALFTFEKSFVQRLMSLKEMAYLYESLDFEKYRDKHLVVYLSTWMVNPQALSILSEFSSFYKVYKPHPHIKKVNGISDPFDEVLQGVIPAEIFLLLVSQYCSKLVVIHENSTALLYMSGVNFEEINIGDTTSRIIYDDIRYSILSEHSN